jgi:NADH-quinone oxidoreductase subunit L
MTLPLVVLAFFALSAGWVGIPEEFPGLGRLVPGVFNRFVSSTLLEPPHPVEFNFLPLIFSILVSLGGLYLGWLLYRSVKAGDPDPLRRYLGNIYVLLQRKYYFDELYNFLFVRPAIWISEVFAYRWLDRGLIDGILHTIARVAFSLGSIFRNWFDKPVVNGFGDMVGEGVKWLGKSFRFIQTGRVQQYMVMALIIAFGTLFYYLFFLVQP